MKSLSPRAGQILRLCLGLAISALCLVLAFKNLDMHAMWQAISQADPKWLIVALLFVMINNLAKAARWKVLLGARGQHIPFTKALVSHMAGQTLNTIFPARVGDLSRVYTVGGMAPGRVYVLGTVVIEKIPDMLMLAAMFLVLFVLLPLPEWVGVSGNVIILVASLCSLAVMYLVFRGDRVLRWLEHYLKWLPQRWQEDAGDHLSSAYSSLEVFRSRWQVLKLTFWTLLIWFTALAINSLVFQSLGLELPVTAALLLLVVLQLGIVLPSAPARIGIFEYICILCLAVFGVGQAEALGYGILLHALIFLPIAVMGLAVVGLVAQDTPIEDGSDPILKSTEVDSL